jgi:hypothetical protein
MVTVKSIAAVEKMKLDFCKPFALEIVGLYPIMKTLQGVQRKRRFAQIDFAQRTDS